MAKAVSENMTGLGTAVNYAAIVAGGTAGLFCGSGGVYAFVGRHMILR